MQKINFIRDQWYWDFIISVGTDIISYYLLTNSAALKLSIYLSIYGVGQKKSYNLSRKKKFSELPKN